MISMQEFMEVVNYRVTEGDEYTWRCFGPDARPYSLSAWNGDHNGWSFCITFDTNTQEVYIVEACDYKHGRAYRIINQAWVKSYNEYADRQNPSYKDEAWEGVDFVDLETDDDWIQKSLSIVAGEDYDTRVSVPLDISEQDLLMFMKAAHERDMTFNQFVEEAIKEAIKDFERDPEAFKTRASTWSKQNEMV